ncbi:OLC1v1012948C1 [Oldenlandia corymbosa var. corymbosa]|uniref:OLC1v1012948C1 n=1 Tax=Oldenlandia corymbosa var. corymbosa TaxID=529605 RepID=A0AAV1DXC8_OLDCO|nr:OLC1v1012948C1 [Oldenlandia corymbosa var. corymbosa]
MDPKYTGEMLRHLDKENELLTVAYKSMSDELHKLQVEEEMLMRKFYEFMSAQGPSKKDNQPCIFLAPLIQEAFSFYLSANG